MHKDAKSKFVDDEVQFASTTPTYFEHRLPLKYKGIINLHPGDEINRFYAKKAFVKDINIDFMWYMSGWNDCYAHMLKESDCAPIRRTLDDYLTNFLYHYTKNAKTKIEFITLTHEGLIRHADFVAHLNHDLKKFKSVRKVLCDIYERPLFGYPVFDMIRTAVIEAPAKAKYYDFSNLSYVSDYTIEGENYIYEELSDHPKVNDWVSFTGPIASINHFINNPTQFELSTLIEEYNDIVAKFSDVLNIYAMVHDKGESNEK